MSLDTTTPTEFVLGELTALRHEISLPTTKRQSPELDVAALEAVVHAMRVHPARVPLAPTAGTASLSVMLERACAASLNKFPLVSSPNEADPWHTFCEQQISEATDPRC